MMSDTKVVPVISWVNYAGGEQTSGGFDWYYQAEQADDRFDDEVAYFVGGEVVIRRVDVPDVPADLDDEELTNYLDERIDDLEVHLPALRVHDSREKEDA